MTTCRPDVREARHDDIEQLLPLWASLFDEDSTDGAWQASARFWFGHAVEDPTAATFPVIEVDGRIVACGIGTLETGVPNPQSPTGRLVRLANVLTLPGHRGQGYGTALTEAVIGWARGIGADRVDLSATPAGRRVYERIGFVVTSAPRMKLPLG